MSRREQRDEYELLRRRIQSWNETRVELFKISPPNENAEFSGVMKFYFQYEEREGQKVATKCIRVRNTDTVSNVIEILVQKFRPDLKMLPNLSSYSLYEIHNESREGEVRKMDVSEKPLLEMMKWSMGDREGRFLLRNELSSSLLRVQQPSLQLTKNNNLSPKRNKKPPKNPKDKRKSKKPRAMSGFVEEGPKIGSNERRSGAGDDGRFADTLYENYPSSKFTRSITNPEIVKNAWNSTADKRMRSSYQAIDELGTDEGSVCILGGSILPNRNIVAGNNDTAAQIIANTIERFRLTDVSSNDVCLVLLTLPPVGGHNGGKSNTERIKRVLDDTECPVKVHTLWMLGEPGGVVNRDILQFQMRRRASLREQTPSQQKPAMTDPRYQDPPSGLRPFLVCLSHGPNNQKKYHINSFPIEIGSNLFLLNADSHICLPSPNIAPRHCAISLTYKGSYTIQPLDDTALLIVNEQIVNKIIPLPLDSVIKLTEHDVFQFTIPSSTNQTLSPGQPCSSIAIEKANRLSKAHSIDNNLTPTGNDKDHISTVPSHNRTVSEHTLKSEMGVSLLDEGEDTDHNDEEKDQFDTNEDELVAMTEGGGGVVTAKVARNTKKRHNSAPHCSDLGFLEETPESELAVLPASISFTYHNETPLLQALISEVSGCGLEFKLAPAYSLYMIARHHLSSEYHPESSRHHSLIYMIKQTCSLIKRSVKESKQVPGMLAFWLSNTSELLHFLRRDYRLCMFAHEYENILTSIIHMAYKHFTEYMCTELGCHLSVFLSESPDADNEDLPPFKTDHQMDQTREPDVIPSHSSSLTGLTNQYWSPSNPRVSRSKTKPTIGCIMATLKAAFSLLHQCRVNNTLAILIFNLLFRYMSMKLFNKLVKDPKCCSHSVAVKMMRRLKTVKTWAVRKGLNIPVDDHLMFIFQAVWLLQTPKRSPEDASKLQGVCNRLNSAQTMELLKNYETTEGEGSVNGLLKEQLVTLAVQNVDQALISNGMEITLQEKPNLQLPFLIPEQGYSCDSMRGLPVGLEEYLEYAIKSDMCQLHITKDALGCWVPPRTTMSNQRESPLNTQASTQMSQTLPKNFSQTQNPYGSIDYDPHRPSSEVNLAASIGEQLQVVTVKLKKSNKTLGINICERKVNIGPNQSELLIFIKSLSDDGPAKKNGKVDEGDQILKVDSTVLKGITKQMVIKLLSNSGSEVTLMLAKRASEYYGLMVLPDTSPYTDRKTYTDRHIHESSHSIKAHRRQLREQQGDWSLPRHMSNHHQFDYHQPHGGYNQTHTARWIQEQRDRSHHRPTRPTQSLNSLIEKEESYSTNHLEHGDNTNKMLFDSSLNATPSGSDLSDSTSQHGQYNSSKPIAFDGKYSRLGTSSKLHDPLSATKSSYSDYSYSRRRMSTDSQYSNGLIDNIPMSLSVQMSESSDPTGSQAYPSLMLEKLSMEVGCHTQNNSSSAGLTVTNVLEQLIQKSKEAKENSGGLKKNKVKGLDVDEIDLEKQRMKFLFYEQRKESDAGGSGGGNNGGETEAIKGLDKQPPLDPNTKVSEWVTKEQDPILEDEELLLQADPEKLVQITDLQGKLDSLKKMVSDQRKKNREIQFAKERVKQSLQEEEKKVQQAQTRNVKAFMKNEDQLRWQKEQKKRLKDWERVKREKANDLQNFELKEREGRSRLKALEQHFNEIKKQLHACKTSINSTRLLSASDEFGSSKLGEDIPERDWTSSSRPPRIMSTDSITTESSLMSSDNPEIPKDLMSLGSDMSLLSYNEYSNVATRSSPFSNRSDSSSPVPPASYKDRRYLYNPDVHGSMEMKPSSHHHHQTKIPVSRGCSADQDRRLRMLKEEHRLRISSMDNLHNMHPFTGEDRAIQMDQLRHEAALQSMDPVERGDAYHTWSKSSNNVFQYKGSIDNSNVESSLSNTPDVIPEFLVKSIHQSSSAMNLPNQPQTELLTSAKPLYTSYGKHSRPSSGFGYSDVSGNVQSGGYRGSRLGTSSTSTSTEYLNGRVASREALYQKPEKLVPSSAGSGTGGGTHSTYSSHSNLRQRGSGATVDIQSVDNGSMSGSKGNVNSTRKVAKVSNSPSTHKYSHRRPDPSSVNGSDDRLKNRAGHASSHSNLFTIGGNATVQRQQTKL